MKIIAFAASSSRKSINKQLVTYAAGLLPDCEAEILDLNNYELPLFSEDKEVELGQPDLAKAFLAKLSDADALVVSFAEHNGSYSAAYKNLFDWCSRITREIFAGKPMVMLSTSSGPGGGGRVLDTAVGAAEFFAGHVKARMSVPSFHDNFDPTSGALKNTELDAELRTVMKVLQG